MLSSSSMKTWKAQEHLDIILPINRYGHMRGHSPDATRKHRKKSCSCRCKVIPPTSNVRSYFTFAYTPTCICFFNTCGLYEVGLGLFQPPINELKLFMFSPPKSWLERLTQKLDVWTNTNKFRLKLIILSVHAFFCCPVMAVSCLMEIGTTSLPHGGVWHTPLTLTLFYRIISPFSGFIKRKRFSKVWPGCCLKNGRLPVLSLTKHHSFWHSLVLKLE